MSGRHREEFMMKVEDNKQNKTVNINAVSDKEKVLPTKQEAEISVKLVILIPRR
jgi:hypothetical protein